MCDSVAYNIKSDDDKKKILDELNKKYAVGIIQRHHETFSENRHVNIINSNPYLLSVRTNGNPYYLYLTKCNFVNQCILIDKKVQQGYFYPRMILVRLWFDDHLFDNTLFEGEMVRDKYGGWTFLINDMMVYRNESQTDINLVRRLNMIYDILQRSYLPDELDVCCLRVKKYFKCHDLLNVVDHFVPRLPYTCRGLYFKPFFLKFKDVLYNFDDSLIKKIVKTTYKGAGNFLLMTENDEIIANDDIIRHPPPSGVPAPVPAPAVPAPLVGVSVGAGAAHVPSVVPNTMRQQPHHHAVSDQYHHEQHADIAKGGDGNGASQEHQKRGFFWVRHTNLPDVYELYENASDIVRGASTSMDRDVMIASVPNLRTSRFLRSIFQNLGVTDAVYMECVYCDKFKKWTPVREMVNPTGTSSSSPAPPPPSVPFVSSSFS